MATSAKERKRQQRDRQRCCIQIPVCSCGCGRQLKGSLSRERGVASVCWRKTPEGKAIVAARVKILKEKSREIPEKYTD